MEVLIPQCEEQGVAAGWAGSLTDEDAPWRGKVQRITCTQLIPQAGPAAVPQPPATKFLLLLHAVEKGQYKRGAVFGARTSRCLAAAGGRTLPSPDGGLCTERSAPLPGHG